MNYARGCPFETQTDWGGASYYAIIPLAQQPIVHFLTRETYLPSEPPTSIPKATYKTRPASKHQSCVPHDRWDRKS